jgi:hypothetical protein
MFIKNNLFKPRYQNNHHDAGELDARVPRLDGDPGIKGTDCWRLPAGHLDCMVCLVCSFFTEKVKGFIFNIENN